MIKRNEQGFSLMEVMMVVVIIGILAAVAIPGMGGWFAQRDLNSATRTLYSHFQQARSEAIRNGEEVEVCFDTGTTPDRYTVVVDNKGTIVPWTSLPSADLSFSVLDFNGVLADNSTGFDSRGLALQPGSVTIHSTKAPQNSRDRIISLSIGGGASISE